LDLPKQLPAKEWIARLRQHHILVSSIDHCFLKTFPKVNGFRLSIIQTDKTQIEKGIRMMGEVYKKQLKSKSSAFPPKTVIHWI
jgi:DNA-binding transcriptional MocR family regulator